MKFKIRFADQIVGFFVVLALASLVFIVVMLGQSQRWFANDVRFFTVLPTAGGLSRNMAVQYKGFTVGHVESFSLTPDSNVRVIFVIHEEFADRVRFGSMVELMVNPIGLGNQFLFHAGRGDILFENSFIPVVGTAEAKFLPDEIAAERYQDDSIALLLNRVTAIVGHLEEALGTGSEVTQIGQIVGSIQTVLAGVEELPVVITSMLDDVWTEFNPIIANISTITSELTDPDGLLFTVLNTEEEVYTNLVRSLNSVSSMLENLETVTAFIPSQLPQLAGLIMEIRVTLQTVEELLEAVGNNPLLRRGIPERREGPGTSPPRNIRF